ncbi:MAG: YHYH protein [Flavobacterium sp.]
MKNNLIYLLAFVLLQSAFAQTNPAITKWLQNNTTTGTYYTSGNSTAISNGILVNCQQVRYSANFVYVNATGIPAYPVGPYLDGNPNQAGNQNSIFKFPLIPTPNTGTPTATGLGNIGVFINGVSIFNYSDAVSWKNSTGAFAGGPLGGAGDGVWNRDAIKYERAGFDCSKGHPAGTNYHHHQNPSAFKNDLNLISNVCNLYDADGLYVINASQHSPLLGFAYDGYPIYGAYAYANADGTGGIVRMKSSYQLRNITTRTTNASGATVTAGPPVNTTYPLGSFQEDYEYVAHTGDASYLDVHNGRFCVTPEYPSGIYCYFATVDVNHNSVYPYIIGPTYYGVYANRKVTSVTENTTNYVPNLVNQDFDLDKSEITIFPNPTSDLIIIQIGAIVEKECTIDLIDMNGKVILSNKINQGQTLSYLDIQTVHSGVYFVKISNGNSTKTSKVIIE